MEHLSVQDQPPPQPSNGSSNQPGPLSAPQLPPQMFTTAAQLLDLTDSMSLYGLVLIIPSISHSSNPILPSTPLTASLRKTPPHPPRRTQNIWRPPILGPICEPCPHLHSGTLLRFSPLRAITDPLRRHRARHIPRARRERPHARRSGSGQRRRIARGVRQG